MQTTQISNDNINQIIIKDLVAENFHTAHVFEKYGIDFCCKGNRPLQEAIEEKKLNADEVVAELKAAATNAGKDEQRYEEWDLNFLSQYIVNNHHSYVRDAVPRLLAHTKKVAAVHGKNHPHMKEVAEIFQGVAEEITAHLDKEEQILFPLIKYLVDCKRFEEKPRRGGFSTVQNPIRKMMEEHDSAGDSMYKIRELTNNYSLPEDACSTFTLTYKELDEFEKDLHKHVHLENNILFPKSVELEDELVSK